jgi:hypothetical protein
VFYIVAMLPGLLLVLAIVAAGVALGLGIDAFASWLERRRAGK